MIGCPSYKSKPVDLSHAAITHINLPLVINLIGRRGDDRYLVIRSSFHMTFIDLMDVFHSWKARVDRQLAGIPIPALSCISMANL